MQIWRGNEVYKLLATVYENLKLIILTKRARVS